MAWPIKPWKVMEEPQMPITEWKKTIGKGYIVYDLNCMALWKMQKNGDSKKEQWLPRIRAQGEMNRWNTQDMGVVKLFCMILQWWILLITYVSKPIEHTTPRMKTNVNYRLWVIILCQRRLINFLTNVLLWWVMLTVGEAIHVWGDTGNLCTFLSILL